MPHGPDSSGHRMMRAVLLTLLGLFLAGLAAIVFLPIGWPLNRFVVRLYTWGRELGIRVPLELYDIALNMLLFAVPAVLLAMLWPRVRWWVWVVALALASAVIEVVQLLALPRDANIVDVLANTAGAALGAGVVALWRRARSHSPRRGPGSSGLTVLARVLLVPYGIALALVVWLPATAASKVTGVVFRFARFVSDHTDISLATSYTVFEFLANIALFVPLGLLLVAAWPRNTAWIVVLLGYAASVTIELVQTMIPGRFPTLSDVIANTLGTAIGCLIARVFVRRHPPRPSTVPSVDAGESTDG